MVSWISTPLHPSYSIAATVWSHDNVAFAAGFNTIDSGDVGSISKSTDYGLSWISVVNTTNYLFGLSSRFINNTIYYVAVGSGGNLYNSTGDGDIWTSLTTFTALSLDLYGVSIGLNGQVFVCGKYYSIYSSKLPLSSTWSKLSPKQTFNSNETFFDISTFDGVSFIAVGSKGYIYHLNSNGSSGSWSAGSTISVYCIAHGAASTAISAGTNSFVAKTTNGGASWTVLSVYSSTSVTTQYKAVSFLSMNEIFIAGTNGEIHHSIDGGDNWSLQSSMQSVTLLSIAILNNEKGVLGSSDQGIYTIVPGNKLSLFVSRLNCN